MPCQDQAHAVGRHGVQDPRVGGVRQPQAQVLSPGVLDRGQAHRYRRTPVRAGSGPGGPAARAGGGVSPVAAPPGGREDVPLGVGVVHAHQVDPPSADRQAPARVRQVDPPAPGLDVVDLLPGQLLDLRLLLRGVGGAGVAAQVARGGAEDRREVVVVAHDEGPWQVEEGLQGPLKGLDAGGEGQVVPGVDHDVGTGARQ